MAVPIPSSGFERKEAVLIINPAAHNVPALKLRREAEEWLREAGWRFRWEQTTETGHATRIAARAAAEKVPLVLALGGDGTLNEVANGLAGTETALGTLPAGTSNIWAREAGISRKLVEAVRLMATGERRLIDLGKAGDRYFMLFAGIGVDAQITRTVSLDMKRHVGAAAYGVAALREALRWRSRPVTVRLDGVERRMDVLMAFAGNTRLYAGLTKITPNAVVDDGLLDVCIYEGSGSLDIAMHTARTLLKSHKKANKVLCQQVKRLEFDWEDPLPIQLDGDPVGDCPREIEVAPGALWVIVPAGLRTGLFAGLGRRPREAELSPPRPQTG
ncbi:MAG: diacylglycerol kinase family lipid kinase [Chloroflexi bacterium]|nr:diacylglycerol kinase family lipid kinase [Chloroflexota bacterium]MCI0819128.1 diacylglycerol kinase family lipid kinase [Chloroflexota bacterium]